MLIHGLGALPAQLRSDKQAHRVKNIYHLALSTKCVLPPSRAGWESGLRLGAPLGFCPCCFLLQHPRLPPSVGEAPLALVRLSPSSSGLGSYSTTGLVLTIVKVIPRLLAENLLLQ